MSNLTIYAPKLTTEIPAGTHLAIINNIRLLKDEKGNKLTSSSNELGLIVEFANTEGKKHQQIYWVGGKRQYAFDKMMKSIELDNITGSIPKKRAIGKRLWISVGVEYFLENNLVDKSTETFNVFTTNKIHNIDSKPTIYGDPLINNGKMYGDFVKYKKREEVEKLQIEGVATNDQPAF